MKFYFFISFITFLDFYNLQDPPSISVNYIPKKQWKLSKHDLADIKLDIEREVNINNLILNTDEIKNFTSTIKLGKSRKVCKIKCNKLQSRVKFK